MPVLRSRWEAPLRVMTSAWWTIRGAWSPAVLKNLGLRAPIQSSKGDSFSVNPADMPAHVINMPESNAAGHNMLGLTLGPASAELAINAVGGHQLHSWSAPFDANRFGSRGYRRIGRDSPVRVST